MSIFSVGAPCPIFAPAVGESDVASVTFQRPAHIVEARAITVNSAGETVLSFVDVATVTGDLQPSGGQYLRMIQGTVVQIDAMLYVLGNPDVQVGDRCLLSAAQMEIVSTQQYGVEHNEISLHHVGR